MSCEINRMEVCFSRLLKLVCFVVLFAACAVSAKAQSANGQIGGVVLDATGSAVPDAAVVATNIATGVDYSATTNGAGVYFIPEILPGPYKMTVTKQGFALLAKSGLDLRTGDHLTLNLTLQVAAASQTVTVAEDFIPLMISADQTSSATVLDNKMITELPQLNRNTLDLTSVTPAVQGAGPLSNQIATLGNAGYLIANNGNSYSVAGGQVNGTTISVDGTLLQDQEFNAVNRSIPTPDTIGEFRVESGVLTADHGRYSGGIISMNTQSGTSDFHGRLFEYFRNQDLNANDWSDNASGIPIRKFHQNNYGISVGGPVWIPKVYVGKNRTFFYFGWEGERFSQGSTVKSSVPTQANRNGDFSQTVINTQNGSPIYANIYDPFNGHSDSSGNWVRPQFPGSVIPAAGTCKPIPGQSGTCFSTQSQIFQHYANIFPLPNHAPFGVSDHIWNRYDTINSTRPSDRFFLRMDHNLAAGQRFSASVSRSRLTNTIPAPFAGAAQSVTNDHDVSGSGLYTWVISPRSILDVHLGFGWSKLNSDGVSGYGMAAQSGLDTSTWGFDPLIVNNPEKTTVNIPPGISLGNANPGAFGYTTIGGSEFDTFINQNINGTASFTRVVNRHTLKAGFELYFMRFNEVGGDHTGVAWINPGGGSNQTWNNPDGLTGSPLAELMMGSSNFFQWGNWNIAPFGWNEAAYVTDDWKVNSKLTVQMGLRWDHDGGRQSRYPKGSLQYDMSAQNVLKPNAGWDWSQVTAAVPGLSNLGLPQWVKQGAQGRVVLLDTPEYPQKNLYTTDWKSFQPRVGIAYSPIKDTVLRASAGIIYQGLGGLSTDWFSFYYNSVTFNQISSLDGQHWISELGSDHGLRTFPVQPTGLPLGYYSPVTTNAAYGYQTFGAAANLDQGGTTIGHFNSPEEYMWEFSVQRQITPRWVFTAGYTGIRGIHLLMPVWGWSTNNIPLQDYSLGDHLFDQVSNPFYGQSQTFASQPTVPLYQLLGGAPQYAQVSPGQATWGKSLSNFLTLQMQSRNWHGLTLLASYSIRKTLTNTAGKDIQHNGPAGRGLLQNPHNLMEAYGVALYELPQTLLLNYSYDLPFGRGRRFLSSGGGWSQRLTDFAVGGWGIAGVSTWYPKGTPVLMPNVSGGTTAPGAALRWSLNPGTSVFTSKYSNSSALIGIDGNFAPGGQGILNSAAFVRTPNYRLSNAAFVFPNVRNPGGFYTDATILKKFYFSKNEELNLEFRAEALNIFNHPNYGPVDNNPDSSTFGGLQGKSGNRVMQLGLRLFF
jgi:hypothetical protein